MTDWRMALSLLREVNDLAKREELTAVVARHIEKLEGALVSRALEERPAVRQRELHAELTPTDVQFIADPSDEAFLVDLYQARLMEPGLMHLRPSGAPFWIVCAPGEDILPGDVRLFGVLAESWRSISEADEGVGFETSLVRFSFARADVAGRPETDDGAGEEDFVRGDSPFIGAELQIGDRIFSATCEGILVEKAHDAVSVRAEDGSLGLVALGDILRVRRERSGNDS